MLNEESNQLRIKFEDLLSKRKVLKEKYTNNLTIQNNISKYKNILLEINALHNKKDLISDSFYMHQNLKKENLNLLVNTSIVINKVLVIACLGFDVVYKNNFFYAKRFLAKRIYYNTLKNKDVMFMYNCEINDNYELVIHGNGKIYRNEKGWDDFCREIGKVVRYSNMEEFFGLNDKKIVGVYQKMFEN
ncbi:hypothetical protein GVAV_000897 [Gurleya vavrai]